MEDEMAYVYGEASRQSLIKAHHMANSVAPSIPQHLVEKLNGFDGDYLQFANFPWEPIICYMLDFPGDARPPATYIEHGMTTDYFGIGYRDNGYNTSGGIVACSGGIFISQQDSLGWLGDGDGNEPPLSFNQSMESFNMYLAPIMDRPNIEPSVGIIYSQYRHDFWLFSSIKDSWGASYTDKSPWVLPKGWGIVGADSPDGYVGWLNLVIAAKFSKELTAAARYLQKIDVLRNLPMSP